VSFSEEHVERLFNRARDLHLEILLVAEEVVRQKGGTVENYLLLANSIKAFVFMAFEDAWLRWTSRAVERARRLVEELEEKP